MRRALARPLLTERRDVLERLEELHTEWDKPDRASERRAELEQSVEGEVRPLSPPPTAPVSIIRMPAQKQPRPGRNDPCWCGSGKKYKRCHLPADKQQDQGR